MRPRSMWVDVEGFRGNLRGAQRSHRAEPSTQRPASWDCVAETGWGS